MKNYDILVVGCGLAGATSARLLAEQGYKVLLIEQKNHIGGGVFDYKDEAGITVHKYGPHIFHTYIKRVWEFVNRFSEFSNYEHLVLSCTEGKFFNFPINLVTLKQVFGIELSSEEVYEFLQSEVAKSCFNKPPLSFREVVVSQVGEKLYKMFFENYTRKQWNCDPEELSPDLAGRIPVRANHDCRYFADTYQGIPINGYTPMVTNMINHINITTLLNTDYKDVKSEFSVKLLVYTGELDKFFDCAYGKLTYRSVKLDFKTFDQEQFQNASVINYPNDYDYTRITEFKRITGELSNKTTICYEYPSAQGLPFYTMPDKRNMDLRTKYMHEVKTLESTGKFLFIGRLAEYKYYNMDLVIDSAFQRVQKWSGF